MPWHQSAMKDVISCDKLRGGAHNLWSGDFRMGKPGPVCGIIRHWIHRCREVNGANWNILVASGKEINRDSPSSGERTGTSLNRVKPGVVGPVIWELSSIFLAEEIWKDPHPGIDTENYYFEKIPINWADGFITEKEILNPSRLQKL